jgi:hypothetical protein
MNRLLLFLALCFVCIGCNEKPLAGQSSPTSTAQENKPSPLEEAIGKEFLTPPDSVEQRMKIREVVLNYLRTEHPDWQFQGMALSHYEGDPGYYTGVDVVVNGKSKLVPLKVWLLVRENGETYWKVGAL